MILYISSKGEVLKYCKGRVYKNEEELCVILNSIILRALCHFRLFSRLLRLEPRCATSLDDDKIIIAFRHSVLILSISKKQVIEHIPCRKGFSHPLSFCSLWSNGYTQVIWGDYGPNRDEDNIFIYRYSTDLGLEKVYTFPPHSIKHIHSVVFDKWRHRFLILTGDFGNKVGIYIADFSFKSVKPFLVGSEKYRAVQCLVLEDGMIWATDAVMTDNFLYFYSFLNNKITILSELNGSVIYGTKVNGGLLFSTTVETYPSSNSRLRTILDDRLGPGIKSRDVYLHFVTPDRRVFLLGVYSKDYYPMRLFQYGQFLFPEYEETEKLYNKVFVNPVGIRRIDGKGLFINMVH